MNKIEIGLIVTIILAFISGALFIGQIYGRLESIEIDAKFIGKLDGRLEAIENDKDFKSIIRNKESNLEAIKLETKNSKEEIRKLITTINTSALELQKSIKINKTGNIGLGKNPTSKLDVAGQIRASGGKIIYSCPALMPSSCDAATVCQSMCVGQLQINKSTCTHRHYGGGASEKKCTVVGRLVAP